VYFVFIWFCDLNNFLSKSVNKKGLFSIYVGVPEKPFENAQKHLLKDSNSLYSPSLLFNMVSTFIRHGKFHIWRANCTVNTKGCVS
jgi:hypothetical protein